MAQKRMFDKEIIQSDDFIDLSSSSKAMYFLLGIEADDEGFVSPKKVLRLYGGNEDDVRMLALRGLIIPFQSGVVVITDWKANNWLDNRRIKPTRFIVEKKELEIKENRYCLANAKRMLSECLASIEENSIEESRIEENRGEEQTVHLHAPTHTPSNNLKGKSVVKPKLTGLEKSLEDNFPKEEMETYAENKRIKLKVVEDYKEQYMLWVKSNPKKKDCLNRDMGSTVKMWISRDIKAGKIVPRKTDAERFAELEAEFGPIIGYDGERVTK